MAVTAAATVTATRAVLVAAVAETDATTRLIEEVAVAVARPAMTMTAVAVVVVPVAAVEGLAEAERTSAAKTRPSRPSKPTNRAHRSSEVAHRVVHALERAVVYVLIVENVRSK